MSRKPTSGRVPADGRQSLNGRIPTYLSAKPMFWMAADRESNAPSIGSNDSQPTNLVDYNNFALNQGSSTNQPSWEGSDTGWDFDGDDFWEMEYNEDYAPLTVAGVYKHRNPGDDSNVGMFALTDDDENIFLNVRFDAGTQGRFIIDAFDSENNGSFNVISLSGVDQKTIDSIAWVVSIDYDGSDITIRHQYIVKANDETVVNRGYLDISGNEEIISLGGSIEVNKIYLGKTTAVNPLDGFVKEFMVFDSYDIDPYGLCHSLANKWRVREENRLESNRMPNYLPSYPSIHIDHSRDHTLPPDGEDHVSPENLVPYNDKDLFQDRDNSRPSSQSEAWSFDGSEYWDFQNHVIDPAEKTIVFCLSLDDFTQNHRLWSHRNGSDIIFFYQKLNDTFFALVRDSGSGLVQSISTAATVSTEIDPGDRIVVSARYDLNPDNTTIDIDFFGYNVSGSGITNGDFSSNQQTLFRRSDLARFAKGDLFEFMEFEHRLEDSEIKDLSDYLRNKWDAK